MTNTPQTIGWIGVGRMGAPMVERLLAAGHSVSISNRTGSPGVGPSAIWDRQGCRPAPSASIRNRKGWCPLVPISRSNRFRGHAGPRIPRSDRPRTPARVMRGELNSRSLVARDLQDRSGVGSEAASCPSKRFEIQKSAVGCLGFRSEIGFGGDDRYPF